MFINDEHLQLMVASANEALFQLPHEMQDKVTIQASPNTGVIIQWSRAFAIRITMDFTGDGVKLVSPFEERHVPFSALPDTIVEMVVTVHAILAENDS